MEDHNNSTIQNFAGRRVLKKQVGAAHTFIKNTIHASQARRPVLHMPIPPPSVTKARVPEQKNDHLAKLRNLEKPQDSSHDPESLE